MQLEAAGVPASEAADSEADGRSGKKKMGIATGCEEHGTTTSVGREGPMCHSELPSFQII